VKPAISGLYIGKRTTEIKRWEDERLCKNKLAKYKAMKFQKQPNRTRPSLRSHKSTKEKNERGCRPFMMKTWNALLGTPKIARIGLFTTGLRQRRNPGMDLGPWILRSRGETRLVLFTRYMDQSG